MAYGDRRALFKICFTQTRCAAVISTNAREFETCLTLAEVKSDLALGDASLLPGLGA